MVAQKGIDDNAYGLALACFFAALLSGMRLPYIALVAAGFALTGVWSAATRRWPIDEAESKEPVNLEAD